MEWEIKQTGSLLEAIYAKVHKEGSREGVGRSPQASCPCWLLPSGQLSSPGLRQGWLFCRGILDIAQAGGRLWRNSLSGSTDIQPNSLARAGIWGRVPRDGTGRQETWHLFSRPKAELSGSLSSGRGRKLGWHWSQEEKKASK